jgi:hypothetical protein
MSLTEVHNFRQAILEREKIEISAFLESVMIFSSQEYKYSEMKVAEEYCWAITHVAGRSRCGRLGSSVFQFEFQLDSLAYKNKITDQIHTQCRVAQNSTCARSSRTPVLG